MTKSKDIELVLNSVRKKRSMLYRECIDRAQARSHLPPATEDSSVLIDVLRTTIQYPAITLSQLKEAIPEGETVITELDMVNQVFQVVKLGGISHAVRDNIDNNPPIEDTFTDAHSMQYLLAVCFAYCESLLSYFIYPHKRLQAFLIDICVETSHFANLQHLLNYHFILDSPDLLDKLASLKDCPFAQQTRLDAARRMGRSDIVIEHLTAIGRADEIIPYIRKHDPQMDLGLVFQIVKNSADPQAASTVWRQVEMWSVSSGSRVKPTLTRELIMAHSSP